MTDSNLTLLLLRKKKKKGGGNVKKAAFRVRSSNLSHALRQRFLFVCLFSLRQFLHAITLCWIVRQSLHIIILVLNSYTIFFIHTIFAYHHTTLNSMEILLNYSMQYAICKDRITIQHSVMVCKACLTIQCNVMVCKNCLTIQCNMLRSPNSSTKYDGMQKLPN